jgi:hypothetical protein
MPPRFSRCAAVLASLLLAARAAAGPATPVVPAPSSSAPPPSPDGYGRLVDEALAEFEGGRFEEALALFEQAYALKPSARAKRGMAKSLFELRAYVRSVRTIDEALASAVDPLPANLQAELQALRERAMRFVGTVSLVVTPPDATVLVDGRPLLGAGNAALLLDIGAHDVAVSARGHAPARRTLDVHRGEPSRVSIDLERVSPAQAGEDHSRVAPVALLVGGAALALGGIVGSSLWFADRAAAIDRCVDASHVGARCENGDALVFQRSAAVTTLALSSIALLASGTALYATLREPVPQRAVACGGIPAGLSCAWTRTW